MKGICCIFSEICNMSVTAVFVIVLVLTGRQFLKRASRRFAYYLWMIVAFRLVCPYSFSSAFSLFNLEIFQDQATGTQAEWTGPEELSRMLSMKLSQVSGTAGKEDAAGSVDMTEAEGQRTDEGAVGGTELHKGGGAPEAEELWKGRGAPEAEEPWKGGSESGIGEPWMDGAPDSRTLTGSKEGTGQDEISNAVGADGMGEAAGHKGDGRMGVFPGDLSLLQLLTMVWLTGIAVFLGLQACSFCRLRRSVALAVRFEENVYECADIPVPFVMGFFRPVIYLPTGITENERDCILLHEQCHIRRHDHQVKLLAALLLAVYWFHPLVWLAYDLMCKDMEMSCDEMVVQTAGAGVKEVYSRTLLGLAVKDGERRGFRAGYAAFGNTSVKERIGNILDFKSPGKQAVVLGAALSVLIAAAGLLNGRQADSWMRCVASDEWNVEYEYKLDEKIKSFLIYKECYEQGELCRYQVIRAENLEDAGVKRKGRFSVGSRVSPGTGGIAFQHRFDGEEAYVNSNYNGSFWSYGYLGYPGMMEDYYFDNRTDWQRVEAEQEIALTAWHLIGGEQNGFRAMSYLDFMDFHRKQQAVGQNAGEILYYLVFSGKDVRELEEEYKTAPYVRALYEAKCPYIGDAPSVGRLMETLAVFPDMKKTMELETREEPYVLKLHYEDAPEDEADFCMQMEKKAVILLCLIGNAREIEWTYPADTGSGRVNRRFHCTREQASKVLGKDPGRFAESQEAVQELIVTDIPNVRYNYEKKFVGLGYEARGYTSPDGKRYPYLVPVVGRLPGEEYDQLFRVMAEDAKVTLEDVADALAEGDVPGKIYVIP